MFGRRGLLFSLIFIILAVSVSATCGDNGGIYCDNLGECLYAADLYADKNVTCEITTDQTIKANYNVQDNILFFNELKLTDARLDFIDVAASHAEDSDDDFGGAGNGGTGDSDGGNGGAGGPGGDSRKSGENGVAGTQKESCNSGNSNGGIAGKAGSKLAIYADILRVNGTGVISVSGGFGTTGNNCLDTDYNDAGSGGGGGGGGGGAGEIYVFANHFAGTGELFILASGGKGGNGKNGKDDDGTFGGNDDGGGGGGGGGGKGGLAYFKFTTKDASTTLGLYATGGARGSKGDGPDDASPGTHGMLGADGETHENDWEFEDIPLFNSITESDFGNSLIVCSDENDNDGDGLTDMQDPDCWHQPDHPTEPGICPSNQGPISNFDTLDLSDASSNNGRDGCCGDDDPLLYGDCLLPEGIVCSGSDCSSGFCNVVYGGACVDICADINNYESCIESECVWEIVSLSDTTDFFYIDSTGQYFCNKDYDASKDFGIDITPPGDWNWWDAERDSFRIHTIR
ncbi:hypothetical protein H8D36_00935 [archaeon]|nr:hypothetical protein [archaeon]MBL7056679.1 hypothetical protein [Candidatus Woesearchaeota archaeon]